MTKDDIIRMAQEAGILTPAYRDHIDHLERFAALAAAAEREACAAVCFRQPLTDEQIHDCFQHKHRDKLTERRMITRAIEAAHGIKKQEWN